MKVLKYIPPYIRLGVMFSVLGFGPKVRRFKPGRGDGFLGAIKIRSTPSFGREVTAEVQCRKILRRGENHFLV
jgi:hypothetical protein